MVTFFEEYCSCLQRKFENRSIELVLGIAPTSKEPYEMSIPGLLDLKLKLKEIFDKGCIGIRVSQ